VCLSHMEFDLVARFSEKERNNETEAEGFGLRRFVSMLGWGVYGSVTLDAHAIKMSNWSVKRVSHSLCTEKAKRQKERERVIDSYIHGNFS